MVYFLINNDYHLYMDLMLAKQLSKFRIGLIQVPYSLNVVENNNIFSKVYLFNYKILPSLREFILHPCRIRKIFNNIDKELVPEPGDILLVHTEIDLLNQYIIQKFYNANNKIFLLEDGTATMCYYNIITHNTSIKERLKTFILKKFYRFKYTSIKNYGCEILPAMEDSIFSGVIVNFGNTIKRNIPLYKLTQAKNPFEILYDKGAVFFNQPLYFWYISEKEYISYINDLLIISQSFTPFYFKFHPADTDSMKFSITKLINEKYSNVIIISDNDIAENIINKYPVKYSVSFNSTAVLNLIDKNIVPVFLNNQFNILYPNESFTVFENFLKAINCYTPSSLAEVRPGFCAFENSIKNVKTYSIEEIINLNI